MNVREIEAKSILTPATGYIGAYDYVLNPFQGCQFGCSYCYVPMFVYFRRLAPSWGKEIFVKINAPHLLRREAVKGKLASTTRIFISPSTDPYNPVERSYRITRQCLEVLVE